MFPFEFEFELFNIQILANFIVFIRIKNSRSLCVIGLAKQTWFAVRINSYDDEFR